MTGTANDDKGVNSLSYWFRDEQQRYLQADGTVDDIFNSFRGEPDVIGATNATWSYEVTLPHEGVWRGSATATDTIGQADLRSGVRDWRIDSTVVAPTVAISQPVEMTPPFAAPTVTVEPGSRVTFSGTAEDDQGLRNVEITLRNSSTGEGLANDCTLHRRRQRHLPDLAGRHRRLGLQLDLHHAVRPHPGHLQLHGAGHRRRGQHHVVEQPGPADHQRHVPG